MLGLAVGSFLNVVIWRVPRGESVVHPPSACPRCSHPIRSKDNVPVMSWLLLRGRCRDCEAPISWRYPLVELTTGIVFALIALLGPDWTTPLYLYGAAIAIALTLIDIDVHRLPDRIVLPSYPVVLVLLVLASWGADDWPAMLRAVIGGAALLLAYFLMVLAYPAGMGLGDVKLAGIIGAYLAWAGWGQFAVGAFAAFILGGAYSVGLLLARKANRKSGVPFGPWMIAGALLGLLCGTSLWSAYTGLFT
ncbi:prepilin peptidase [Sanguibacter sp. YZGR15]|uniref:Prepilin leader peptidase/N-methyltransferase n=2 Tax=Sanguibacter suaedae TaxID=2795737 RepID=A0A934IAW5_9MICO|nr:prepilin peptidase [Sanguibacter suaedae]